MDCEGVEEGEEDGRVTARGYLHNGCLIGDGDAKVVSGSIGGSSYGLLLCRVAGVLAQTVVRRTLIGISRGGRAIEL
jgi:hypothetical protein